MGGQISSSGKNITGNLNTIPHLVTGLLPLHARNGFEIDFKPTSYDKVTRKFETNCSKNYENASWARR